jgi:hypothetical protein
MLSPHARRVFGLVSHLPERIRNCVDDGTFVAIHKYDVCNVVDDTKGVVLASRKRALDFIADVAHATLNGFAICACKAKDEHVFPVPCIAVVGRKVLCDRILDDPVGRRRDLRPAQAKFAFDFVQIQKPDSTSVDLAVFRAAAGSDARGLLAEWALPLEATSRFSRSFPFGELDQILPGSPEDGIQHSAPLAQYRAGQARAYSYGYEATEILNSSSGKLVT